MKKDQAKYKISPKGKRKLDFPKKNKSSVKLPLIGKTLYLDVKDVKCTRRLEADLKKLGGTIEEFLSKDINYLITSQPRPNVRRNPDDLSPTPSPFSCDPSPSPGVADDKKPSTTTRGKAIAERARIQSKTTSTLLDNAEKWGIKIVTLEGAFKYINKELQKLPKSPQKPKTSNTRTKASISQYKTFKAPFIKFEASTYAYKPCTSQLDAWPRLNVDTPRGSCPFDGTLIAQDKSREERGDILAAQVDISTPDTPQEEKDEIISGARTHKSVDKSVKKSESDIFASSRLLTAGELQRQKALKKRQERKRGYCECCRVQYEDLDKHCRDDQHREYVRDKSHFEKLDQLIKTVPSPASFFRKEKFKALETQNKQRKPKSREEDDEIVLIPVTPNEKVKGPEKDMKVSPKPSKSPALTGKSSKDRNNGNLTQDLRKMTPNGKCLMKIVKSPKQVRLVSPKKNSPYKSDSNVQEESPRTRNHAKNVSKQLEISVGSPRKSSLTGQCDSPIKTTSLPSRNQTKDVSKELEISVGSPRKSSLTGQCDSPIKTTSLPARNQAKDVYKELDISIRRSPRKSSLTGQCDSPIKTTSLSARDQAKDLSKEVEISVRRSPRKNSLTGKCDSPLKTTSLPANASLSPVKRDENDSKKVYTTLNDSKDDQMQIVGNTGKSHEQVKITHNHMSEVLEKSPVKSIMKSPHRTGKPPSRVVQHYWPKSAEKIVSNSSSKLITKSPSRAVQNQPVIKPQPSLRKSPRKLVQNQTVKFLTAPLCSEIMPCKSPAKPVCNTGSPIKFSAKKSLQSPRKSPSKGLNRSNKVRKSINYNIDDIDYDEQSETTIKTGVEDAKMISSVEKNERTVDQMPNKSRNKENIDKNQSEGKPLILEESTNDKENEVLDSYTSEEDRNSWSKETEKLAVSDDNASKLNHHETEQPVIESTDTEMKTDSPVKKSDMKNMPVTAHENSGNYLGLEQLIELGARKAENPTSSDDFERCIMNAISQGELYHKERPKDIESDRELRSKKSLDLHEVVQIEVQADNCLDSISQNTFTDIAKAKPLKLDSQKVTCMSKTIQDERANEGQQAFTFTEKEIKLFSQPPENHENGEFELPLEIQHEVFFTPTLAERVKSRLRQNSPSSYSLSSPARSRSNSISSNNSDTSVARKLNTPATKVVNKAKHLLKQHVKRQTLNQNLANKKCSSKTSGSSMLRLESDLNDKHQNESNIENLSKKLGNEGCVNKLKNSVQASKARNKPSINKKTNRKTRRLKEMKINCDYKKTKVNSELQSLKDTWNDLSSPLLERSSRSRRKVTQSYNESSELTEDYEYEENQSVTVVQLQNDTVISAINGKEVKEPDNLSFQTEKTEYLVMSPDRTENQQSNLLNGDSDSGRDKFIYANQRLESDTPKKVSDKNEDMNDGRKSPVFNTSPVAKRRKGRAVSKAATNEVDKENSEALPLSEKVVINLTAENVKVADKNLVVENAGSGSQNSKCKRKIKISKAIRNSFLESSPPADSDKVTEVSSVDLNESNENVTELGKPVDKNIPEQTTPNSKKKVPSGCYGSGYSSTPRSERRKAWKRKNVAAGKNKDSHAKKRRKLDKLKFVIHENTTRTKSQRKDRKKKLDSLGEVGRALEEGHRINNENNASLAGENSKSGQDIRILNASDNDIQKNNAELNDSFSLQWKSVVDDKVKLNKSWSLLSSRSVNKLLSSEDGHESFNGFTEEDIAGDTSLASDMSYEECWEVDKAINSDKEFEVDIVEKEEKEENNKIEFVNLLPVFSSPGKKSDSSWFDACEVYIDQSVKSTVEPSSVFKGWTSPRKSRLGSKEIEEMYKSPTKSPKTPRRKTFTDRPVSNTVFDRQQVDVDIEFNYRSPQKDNLGFSPLRMKKGRLIGSPSPQRKTSTPNRRIKYGKDT